MTERIILAMSHVSPAASPEAAARQYGGVP